MALNTDDIISWVSFIIKAFIALTAIRVLCLILELGIVFPVLDDILIAIINFINRFIPVFENVV